MDLNQFLGAAANAVKTSGTSTLTQAVSQLAQGNVNGALSSLTNAPGDLIGQIGAYGQATPGDALRGMNARGDAIQNWCWYCLMPDIINSNAQSLLNVKPSVSLPWYYVQAANTPQRVISSGSVKRNGHNVHYAESYDVGGLSFGFHMDSQNKAQQYLKAWAAQVVGNADPKVPGNQGAWGMPANYKKDIHIVVLSVKKRELLNFRYINCWPADPHALELQSSDASALVQQVSFITEDVDMTVSNDEGIIDQLLNTATGYATSALSGGLSGLIGG